MLSRVLWLSNLVPLLGGVLLLGLALLAAGLAWLIGVVLL
jgi:hypothetical protein